MHTISPASARLTEVRIAEGNLTVTLRDGRVFTVPIAAYPELSAVAPVELQSGQLTTDRRSITWANLDLTLPLDTVLKDATLSAKRMVTEERGVATEDKVLYAFGAVLILLLGAYFLYTTTQLAHMLAVAHNTGAAQEVNFVTADIDRSYIAAQAHLTADRYEHADAATFANTTRSACGLLMGAVLTLLGCLIVIRRVRDVPIEASLDAPSRASMRILTSSPGAFVAVLGTVIIVTTLVTRDTVLLQDAGIAYPADRMVAPAPQNGVRKDSSLESQLNAILHAPHHSHSIP